MDNETQITLFLASNEIPPPFFLYDGSNYVNSNAEAKIKIAAIEKWNKTIFAWIEEKNKFIPIRKEDKDLNIQDFKYIISEQHCYK